MKHFVNILDHDRAELEHVLDRAAELKRRMKAGIADRLLIGRTLGMFFEKPSTRTRVSLEVAMHSMGGEALNLESGSSRLGEREALKDVARVMSRYVDIISVRTFSHDVVETLREWSSVPIINALSDYSHPTQAMADILTYREHADRPAGSTFAYVGDGNNVARSLIALCAKLEIPFAISTPGGYAVEDDFIRAVEAVCPGAEIRAGTDPAEAVRDAAVVYTDVWTSMGQEEEAEARRKLFSPYQVNETLMARAPAGALFMHCLPAHRDEEVTDGVMESPASVVFEEAENRMHINRAIFAVLVGDRT